LEIICSQGVSAVFPRCSGGARQVGTGPGETTVSASAGRGQAEGFAVTVTALKGREGQQDFKGRQKGICQAPLTRGILPSAAIRRWKDSPSPVSFRQLE